MIIIFRRTILLKNLHKQLCFYNLKLQNWFLCKMYLCWITYLSVAIRLPPLVRRVELVSKTLFTNEATDFQPCIQNSRLQHGGLLALRSAVKQTLSCYAVTNVLRRKRKIDPVNTTVQKNCYNVESEVKHVEQEVNDHVMKKVFTRKRDFAFDFVDT
jgi:hypothetical protein